MDFERAANIIEIKFFMDIIYKIKNLYKRGFQLNQKQIMSKLLTTYASPFNIAFLTDGFGRINITIITIL